MSNRNTIKESTKVFKDVVRPRLTEPDSWMILNRHNCLDIHCKSLIYLKDRDVITQYFPNATMCIWAWNNGLKLRNMIHVMSKGKRKKCEWCKCTFKVDAIDAYREHVLKEHIAKGKYGKYTPRKHQIKTEILIEQKEIINTTSDLHMKSGNTEIFIES